MLVKRYDKSRSATYNVGYHIIWCTKYRRKVLSDVIQARLKEVVEAKALELNVRIETIETMPDHVHLFVKANPVDSPHHLVKHFKGITSFTLRKEFPELKRRLPCLWTRSYYVESVGHISETVVKKYIEDQKSK
jgi:putative transposase